MVTVLELLQSTTLFFRKRGIEQPRLNIEHLLAAALGKRRLDLYLAFDQPLAEEVLGPLRDKVRRRAEGEPLQHLIGHWDFCGHTFKTDPRALIPRPETEILAETVLEELVRDSTLGRRLIDVGTGSGVLAITFALARPELEIVGLDVAPEALALALENATRLGVADRIRWLQSDLLDDAPGELAVVVANLPYIPTAVCDQLSGEVRFDPRQALDGGVDGLQVIERLLVAAPPKLAPGALLALEVGHDQAARVAQIFKHENYRDISIVRDYQGVQRIVRARYG